MGRFFRKYAGRSNSFRHTYMTKYDFLLALKQQGVLQTLTQEYGLPAYAQWMEYYEFYLDHPKLSYTEISFDFQASRATIYRAIQFMKAPHHDAVSKY